MDTASLRFLALGLAAAIISNFHRSPLWRSLVLGAATVVFFILLAPAPLALVPFAGFLLAGYLCVRMVRAGWSRYQAAGILLIILLYIWLKKYTFLPEASFLRFPYFTLGLSYVFFRVLHLVIEAGEAGSEFQGGLGAYLLYTLNFTTFVSGPIQKYDEFARDQFAAQPIPLGIRTIGMQLERIIRGFFKVNVVAMLLYNLLQSSLDKLQHVLPAGEKLSAQLFVAVLYPLFLYCNFSGYIDIVIALARLMRLRLPENFDRPFSATSFLDFWNRWHITLSTWLKNYIYNPLLLTLMRRISAPAAQPFLGVLCFFVTFFAVGVWHGRTSEFLFFGILQGGGVAINKLWQVFLTQWLGRKRYREIAAKPLYAVLARGLTFSWFAFTLFWFWAGWSQLKAIFGSASVLEWARVWLIVWIGAAIILAAWERLRAALLSIATSEGPLLTSRYARVVYATAMVIVVAVITFMLNQPAPEIVYKAF